MEIRIVARAHVGELSMLHRYIYGIHTYTRAYMYTRTSKTLNNLRTLNTSAMHKYKLMYSTSTAHTSTSPIHTYKFKYHMCRFKMAGSIRRGTRAVLRPTADSRGRGRAELPCSSAPPLLSPQTTPWHRCVIACMYNFMPIHSLFFTCRFECFGTSSPDRSHELLNV